MRLNMVIAILCLVGHPVMLSADPPGMSSMEAEYDPLDIGPTEQRFLTQLIRRTLEAKVANQPPYHPEYVPPALIDTKSQMVVTLRIDGYARGIGVSLLNPIVEAAQEAALVALSSAHSSMDGATFRLDDVLIDAQVLGRTKSFHSTQGGWMTPGAVENFIDPGLDGIGLFLDGERRWCTPSELIARGVSVRQAIKTLGKEITIDSRSLALAKLSKFRTLHWWESEIGGEIHALQRGMTYVPMQQVTADGLAQSIDQISDYLIYRQRPDGTFAFRYDPAADSYAADEDEIAQSGAIWALAIHASASDSASAEAALQRSIRARRELMIDLPDVENAAFLQTPDLKNQLGATAQFCLALADAPNPKLTANIREQLANAIIWLQNPNGRFITTFPPNRDLEGEDVAPGQAVLALVRCYELNPTQKLLDAIDKAFPIYQDRYERVGSPAMIPWHMQAYSRMARLTKQSKYRDFAFRMADQVCDHQIVSNNRDARMLVGAIAAPGILPANAATAAMLSGLTEAAKLAKETGDTKRYDRYTEACRLAARFVMQLQVRKEECFFVRSQPDTVNGIRTSPIDWRIRIDNCQHALIGLTKARQTLFANPS
ncbi:MAG TPA: hypothetical protein PKN33_12415 [Phycisphaerae bacterium]|nr:hypothetical protein [Phycisphaerae bacterium]